MSKESSNFVGRTITRFRERIGINRAQLAKRLGRQRCVVHRWEDGESGPPLAILPDLATALETKPDTFAKALGAAFRKSC